MAKYRYTIRVRKVVTFEDKIQVDADTEEEARSLTLDISKKMDFPNQVDAFYKIDPLYHSRNTAS